MKVRMIAAMSLLVAGLTTPAAAATTTACGTTATHWVGTFTGAEYVHRAEGVAMSVAVTTAANGSSHPETEVGEQFTSQAWGHIEDGKLRWSDGWWVRGPHGVYEHSHSYTTTSVTCTGGRVSAFHGTVYTFGSSGGSLSGTFTLSR